MSSAPRLGERETLWTLWTVWTVEGDGGGEWGVERVRQEMQGGSGSPDGSPSPLVRAWLPPVSR